MPNFKFKLESVLNQRKKREETALIAFGSAQRALQAAKDHKISLQNSLEQALFRREGLGTQETAGIHSFQLETDFIQGTKHRILQSDQGIARAQKGVEKAMRVYLAARRHTRSIELLREKALEDYKRERAKLEQKRLDDLLVMRARMSTISEGEKSQ